MTTADEQKCPVCERGLWEYCGAARNDDNCTAGYAWSTPEQRAEHWRLGYERLSERIREGKHLISVRMEGFPCADGDACENLKTLQAIGAALDGKEI